MQQLHVEIEFFNLVLAAYIVKLEMLSNMLLFITISGKVLVQDILKSHLHVIGQY